MPLSAHELTTIMHWGNKICFQNMWKQYVTITTGDTRKRTMASSTKKNSPKQMLWLLSEREILISIKWSMIKALGGMHPPPSPETANVVSVCCFQVLLQVNYLQSFHGLGFSYLETACSKQNESTRGVHVASACWATQTYTHIHIHTNKHTVKKTWKVLEESIFCIEYFPPNITTTHKSNTHKAFRNVALIIN